MFRLDLNLDDKKERDDFLNKYGTSNGRHLANTLGLKGKGSALLATALSNYAWNAQTAYNQRSEGRILIAQQYETIADRIYKEDIQSVCECW